MIDPSRKRVRLSLSGAVQGVGFRPFACRLARELKLSGWVRNGVGGLRIEAEGDEKRLKTFLRRLQAERPAAAAVAAVETSWIALRGGRGFRIKNSDGAGGRSAWILPDLAVCPACLKEISTPGERRFEYPFTNCTRCGPRFTIVTGIPYDRSNTTMKSFSMCPDCVKEYEDPADRRFHAQPIACRACGPKIWLEGGAIGGLDGPEVIAAAAASIKKGRIVAVKGIGGFLLLVDARSGPAVRRLRTRKHREEKPFALMFPSIEAVEEACVVSTMEAAWLKAPSAPIVLLEKRSASQGRLPIAEDVAPGSPRLGAMLPYSPLHHLLLARLGFPVVATSGNLSEEPIAKRNSEARAKLGAVADSFLMHDRPIARRAEDSIVRRLRGRQSVQRRARGLAPLPVFVARPLRRVLALGAHLKSTVSISVGDCIVTSQHLGDLSTAAGGEAFRDAAADLCSLYRFHPESAACDLHPDYLSTRYAESLGLPVRRIQHHHAHIAACMAEQKIEPPVFGAAWDGLGLGPDGTLWGGEFLRVDEAGCKRLGHLRTFPLPGGEAAVREPRRAALGLLLEAGIDTERLGGFFGERWAQIRRLPPSGKHSPRTSSMGRLFDAVACLAGLGQVNSFEGQAVMALENALAGRATREAYPLPLVGGEPSVADWGPLLEALIEDADRGTAGDLIAARFHNALVRLIRTAALRCGLERVVLSGGVFQNAYLVEEACAALEKEGFVVCTHQRLPSNDGGISTGQAYLAGMGWGTEIS